MIRPLLLPLVTSLLAQMLGAQPRTVDFRYAPATYLAAICFPGDWQKSLVNEKGALVYDFAPGPYARPLTEISVGALGAVLAPKEVRIADPAIPIVEATSVGSGVSMSTRTFALVLGRPEVRGPFSSGRVTRKGGLNGVSSWALSAPMGDPAFRSVAWGTNRPIYYSVQVPAGAAKIVVLGICDPYKPVAGQRVMELRVEGAPAQVVDPLVDNKRNTPHAYFFDARDADGDGQLTIEVHPSDKGVDPNVILNAFWVFREGAKITEAMIVNEQARPAAELFWNCGLENELGASRPRVDGILARAGNESTTPTVVVRTTRDLVFDSSTGVVSSSGRPFIAGRPALTRFSREGNLWTFEFPGGTRDAEVYVLHGPPVTPGFLSDLPNLEGALIKARQYWKQSPGLPPGRITVPVSGLQFLLDANIRNFYQISEWVDGAFQFQPGPSVYRGLWIHDGAWDVASSLYLGDSSGARRMLETMLRFQQPDGRIFLMEPFPIQRETPLVLYGMERYAALTGDFAWLQSRWKQFSAGAEWIRATRESTLKNPASPWYGLFPPGFADGGIGGVGAEYGSSYWGMIGLRSAAKAASMLGRTDEAVAWTRAAEEFMASFTRAAARDFRTDAAGNRYLPMKVGDTATVIIPQQANWGILDGQGLGNLFPRNAPVVTGTLAMLDAATKEGLTHSAGWLKEGVWPFFGALLGITRVYQGDDARAEEILYAFANHASPLGTWVEEQLPKNEGTRTTGDGSNATSSSLYILFLRHMLALERNDTLDLLAAVPAAWYHPGARLHVEKLPTEWGPLTLTVEIAADGTRGSLHVAPFARARSRVVRVPLKHLKTAGFVRSDGTPLADELRTRGRGEIRLAFIRK
jgi:hypothetical protein